jgi:hypothetical protein
LTVAKKTGTRPPLDPDQIEVVYLLRVSRASESFYLAAVEAGGFVKDDARRLVIVHTPILG